MKLTFHIFWGIDESDVEEQSDLNGKHSMKKIIKRGDISSAKRKLQLSAGMYKGADAMIQRLLSHASNLSEFWADQPWNFSSLTKEAMLPQREESLQPSGWINGVPNLLKIWNAKQIDNYLFY